MALGSSRPTGAADENDIRPLTIFESRPIDGALHAARGSGTIFFQNKSTHVKHTSYLQSTFFYELCCNRGAVVLSGYSTTAFRVLYNSCHNLQSGGLLW